MAEASGLVLPLPLLSGGVFLLSTMGASCTGFAGVFGAGAVGVFPFDGLEGAVLDGTALEIVFVLAAEG